MLKIQPIPILVLKIVPEFTIISVKTILVNNTDFFEKLAKIGQYWVSILGKIDR